MSSREVIDALTILLRAVRSRGMIPELIGYLYGIRENAARERVIEINRDPAL